jgi:hypothetical protein
MLVLCMSRKYKTTMDHKSVNFHMGWTTNLINETLPITVSIIIIEKPKLFLALRDSLF